METHFLVDQLDVDRLLIDWRWLCPQAMALVAKSAFGDLILRDDGGKIFKLDVSAGQIVEIAESETEFRESARMKEKREQWFAESEELAAIERGMKPNPEQCIAFTTPVMFAEAATGNTAYVGSLYEHVSFLGELHRQISGLPEGSKVQLRIVK